jgi:hypothetical protein
LGRETDVVVVVTAAAGRGVVETMSDDMVVDISVGAGDGRAGDEVFRIDIPVIADQISSTGGAGSDQGTVKSGLSHRLEVLGSS